MGGSGAAGSCIVCLFGRVRVESSVRARLTFVGTISLVYFIRSTTTSDTNHWTRKQKTIQGIGLVTVDEDIIDNVLYDKDRASTVNL